MDRLIAILFVSGLFLFFILDICAGKTVPDCGVIVEKQFVPENYSTGTGVGVGSNGPTVVTMNTYSSEKWVIVVKGKDGKHKSVDASSRVFFSKKVNDTICFFYYRTRFTNAKIKAYVN